MKHIFSIRAANTCSAQNHDFAQRFGTVFHRDVSTAHARHMHHKQLYIIAILINSKSDLLTLSRTKNRNRIHSAHAKNFVHLTSLSDAGINKQLNTQLNQQLHIEKNGQVILKKQAPALHGQSPEKNSTVLHTTHQVYINSAQPQHMLTSKPQLCSTTPGSGHKQKMSSIF